MTASDADRIEARASEWLGRRDGDGWSRSDQAALDAWLGEATAHRVAYLRLSAVWDRADRLSELGDGAGRPRAERRFTRAGSIAAGVALVAAAGAAWLLSPGWSVVHATETGQHDEVRLRDGSHLALNTNTKLVAVVDKGTREVWLDHGEAYFEIAHDPAHPFVVHAGRQVITVLGTKFLVREEGDRFRVAVTEGRVRLASIMKGAARPVVLTRGEVATATGDDLLVSNEPESALADDIAWRRGALVFGRVTLGEAVAEFNRYSTRRIVIDDPAVAAIRVGGRFSTENVDGFVHLVESSLGLRAVYRDDEIVISG